MTVVILTHENFLKDLQGRRFADVLENPDQSFDSVLEFFNNADRQRRMEESEIHHNRPPLAGVIRDFESCPDINQSLATINTRQSKRLRQAVGVIVRIIMEQLGWYKTGRKGSLGVRKSKNGKLINHNIGGLSFWFIRAERYRLKGGMPFQTVQERCSKYRNEVIESIQRN